MFFLLSLSSQANAQLDLEHWFPPYYRGEGITMENIYIYLSTDREDAFPVKIYNNNILIDEVVISKNNPLEYYIKDETMIDAGVVSRVMKPSSMGFYLTGQYSFFASLRVAGCSPSAGCISEIFASKGKTALGKDFILVNDKSVLYGNSDKNKNYQASIIATKDNTHVKISNYDKRLILADGSTDDEINITLRKGQSFIFLAQKKDNNISVPPILDDNDPDPIGASITSDKPIVLNNGSFISQDLGESGGNANIDQSVPIDKLGKEYFIVNGMTASDKGIMEKVLIVATKDNTKIYFNNELNPYKTLNKGEYFIGPYGTHKFVASSQPPFVNSEKKMVPTTAMYIRATEPIYLYQMLGGFQNLVRGPSYNQTYTSSGMTFSYPIDKDYKSMPQQDHDNTIVIPFIDNIGLQKTETKINIKSPQSATIKLNGTILNTPSVIVGKEDWKYFSIPLIKGNVEISSDQSIMVDAIGGFPYSGFGSSYTGFSNDPYIVVNGNCVQEGVNLSVSNIDFDGFQWQRNGVDIAGANNSVYQPTLAGDYRCVVSYTGFTFTTKSVKVTDCPYNVIEDNYGDICSSFIIEAKFHIGSHTTSKIEIITQPLHAESTLIDTKIETIVNSDYSGADRLVYKITGTDGYYEIVKVNFNILPHPIADLKESLDPYKQDGQDFYFDLTSAILNLNEETFDFYLTQEDAQNQSNKITNNIEYKAILKEVFARVTNNIGCIIIKKIILNIPKIDTPTDDTIVLPNAFSPNADGVNDFWDYSILIDYPDLKLSVYNKLGMLMYHHEKDFYWNGKYINGAPLPSDAYWVVYSWSSKGTTVSKNQWIYIKN